MIIHFYSEDTVVTNAVMEVGKQFQQALMEEGTKKEMLRKVAQIENRVNRKYNCFLEF